MADRERVLALLHELEDADAEEGALLEELDGFAREVQTIQAAVSRLQGFATRLPSKRERLAAELARALTEKAAARDALAEAEEAVRTAKKDGQGDAQRFEIRARDRLSVAERRNAEAQAAVEELERETRGAEEEAGEIETIARALAETLRGRPRLAEDAGAEPEPGLAGIAAWGEAARAALFVARGQVAAERDAVIRQANELGAVALGEPLTSASAAVVARRVERDLD